MSLKFLLLSTVCFSYILCFPSVKQEDTSGITRLPAPKLEEPKDKAKIRSGAPIEFKWSEIKGAEKYTICYVKRDGSTKMLCFETKNPAFSSPGVINTGFFTWFFFAIDKENRVTYSSSLFEFELVDDQEANAHKGNFISFRKESEAADYDPFDDLPAPTLSYPENRETFYVNEPIILKWSKVDGAAKYTVYLYDKRGTEIQSFDVVTDGAKISISWGGIIKWKVVAVDKYGYLGKDSKVRAFQVRDLQRTGKRVAVAIPKVEVHEIERITTADSSVPTQEPVTEDPDEGWDDSDLDDNVDKNNF